MVRNSTFSVFLLQKDWKFIGRFCFLPNTGRIDFKLRYPISYDYFNLALSNLRVRH